MEQNQGPSFTASHQLNSIEARLHILRNPTENILATIYLQFAAADLLSVIWHTGSPMTLREFLDTALRKDTVYYACFHDPAPYDTGMVQLAGLAWAVDIQQLGVKRIATVGMGFLPGFQRHDIPLEFCHMAVDDGFQNLGIDMMYGYTPLPNLPALHFIHKCGFKAIADMPLYTTFNGEACGVRLSAMAKPLTEV